MKKTIILFIGVCLICLGILNENKKENNELYNADVINKEKNTLSMMLETEFNSGKYEETTGSLWPAEGYLFNSTLSKCKNGSSLSWDNDKKQVIFEGNTKDDCYLYFDVVISLADYVKQLYTGTQGENNLYLHDNTLTNGANDGSYRYAGSSETTNNFVCFGYDSKDGSCPTDSLYRIIGVFDSWVKLIKWDYAKRDLLGSNGDKVGIYLYSDGEGTSKGNNSQEEIGAYYWNNSSGGNYWSYSKLNYVNLNTNYLNNIGSKWSEKIANHTWIVGGNTWENLEDVSVSILYKNEIINPAIDTTYESKVGLMYVSDYGYAAAPSAWTTTLYDYDSSSITGINWMYMGLNEWFITRCSNNNSWAYRINAKGNIRIYYVCFYSGSSTYAIRPTFYLNSNVTYVSGSGTKTEPILIK